MTSNIPVAVHSQPEPVPMPSAVEDPIPSAEPRRAAPSPDRPGVWLHVASAGLLVLAAAAAAVSFTAQYRLVYTARHLATAAGLEAAIPDAAALVFACLGIALALHGRRAVRARALNISSAGASVFMNVIAAAPGWRDVAVWAMPPVAYALASDTLIGVIRTSVLSRQQGPAAAAGEVTLLAVLTGLLLWLLRLSVAPVSTLAGFRAWVLEECPVAPGRRAAPRGAPAGPPPSSGSAPGAASIPTSKLASRMSARALGTAAPLRKRRQRGSTKTARFLALVVEQYGPLAAVPLASVGPICAALAPQVDLNAGSARTSLRRALLAAQNGGQE
jgi:hypothetical protein